MMGRFVSEPTLHLILFELHQNGKDSVSSAQERERHDKQYEVKFKTMWRRDKSAGIGSA